MVCSSGKKEENAWSSKCRIFKTSGSFQRGRPSKTRECGDRK